MTRRRILPRLLAVAALVLALAGCVRFQADLTLNPDNTVDGSIVVAVALQDDSEDSRTAALTAAQQIEDELLGSLRDASGVTTSEYEQDDYLGSRIEFHDVDLDAFSGQSEDSIRIERDGDEYVFSGALDFSGESIPSEDDVEGDDNLTVSVTFPGEVSEHNGELNGTTVSWTTTIDQRLDMSARGAATPGAPILLIVGIVVAVLVLAAAVIAVLLFLRFRKAKQAAAPAGDPAAAETPATVEPVEPAAEAPTAETPAKKSRAPKTPPATEG